jgi:hypothetical protein
MPAWMTTDTARNAFVIFLLAAAFFSHLAESEMDYGEFLGVLLLTVCLFFLVFLARRMIGSVADLATLLEGLILIVVCFLGELPWLTFLPMSYYSALWVNGVRLPSNPAFSVLSVPECAVPWVRLELILTVGVILVLWKEHFDSMKAFRLIFW